MFLLQAVSKKDENKPSEAKKFSIISLVLLVVVVASFPILYAAWIYLVVGALALALAA